MYVTGKLVRLDYYKTDGFFLNLAKGPNPNIDRQLTLLKAQFLMHQIVLSGPISLLVEDALDIVSNPFHEIAEELFKVLCD